MSTHIIFTSKSPIDDANTRGTFKWHINITNTYGTSLWIIQIFIVHILQMFKICTYGSYGTYGFNGIWFFFPYLQMVHISMGLVFIMCTYVYTFVIFKYVHAQAHFNHLHENRYN